jgi:hypothetical protein
MISNAFRTVFVHIPKTAGQSIEEAFLLRSGLTWEQRARLLLRPNNDPRMGPPRLAHLYAREYVELGYLPRADWDSFLKFTVVRNPWERAVSEYKYRYEAEGMPFPQYLQTILAWPRPSIRPRFVEPQKAFVVGRDGSLIVDRVLRYETLGPEFSALSRGIFGEEVALPRRNVSASRRDYRHYYDDASAEFIARLYKDDIGLFGYKFER